MQDSIRSASTGVSDRYQQNTALWNSMKQHVLDPLESLISETCPVFCLHKTREKAPRYGLDDLLELMNIADGPEFGVQFSTRAVLEINSRTMNRREEEIQKLVTKASGIITRHISNQVDACMVEFPQLKTTCSNCLIQVVHQKEREVHKKVYDVISHFHKAVPARRRQIIDHTEVFQKLLFKEMQPPDEWKPEQPYQGVPSGRLGKKPTPPSPLAIFVENYKVGISSAIEILQKQRKKRVQAEEIFDAGAGFWPENSDSEVYYHLHNLVAKMPLDELRTCSVEDLKQKLQVVIDVEEEDNNEEEPDSMDEETDKLPDGWEEAKDSKGKTYYWNKKTDETQWERPKVQAKPPKKSKKAYF